MRGNSGPGIRRPKSNTIIEMGKKRNLFWVLLLLAGCQRDEITVYRAPKEALPSQEPVSSWEGLRWKLPEGWKNQPASGMRFATLSIPNPAGSEAEVSVVVLPGDAGGPLPNVNRWRGQLGLGPWTEKDLSAQMQKIQSSVGEVRVVDLTGPSGAGGIASRMMGAILILDQKTWFFKMTGEKNFIEKIKPSFLDFLRSVHRANQ